METRPCSQPTTHSGSLPLGHCCFHALFSHKCHPTLAWVCPSVWECLQVVRGGDWEPGDFEHTSRMQMGQVLWQHGIKHFSGEGAGGLSIWGHNDSYRKQAIVIVMSVLWTFGGFPPHPRINIRLVIKFPLVSYLGPITPLGSFDPQKHLGHK